MGELLPVREVHRRSDTLRLRGDKWYSGLAYEAIFTTLSDYNMTHLWRDRQGAEGAIISQAKGQSELACIGFGAYSRPN